MGTQGHMDHPFDVPRVGTGQDLISYFENIAEHLATNPGSVKFDGINVSFKLVNDESTPTGKDFRMDRGTSHKESVIGMTAEDAYKKWPEGHGMPPAIDTLLKIFNRALPTIKPELKELGMWDDPTKSFNTEYMKQGKTNVIEYAENILAVHGINQFYEKKAQPHRIRKGESIDRPGLERPINPETNKPIKAVSTEINYDKDVLNSLITKVKPIAEEYNFSLVGDVSTELVAEIDFTKTLSTPFAIQMTADEEEVYPLVEWLQGATNPKDLKVTKSDGSRVTAISKDIYFAVLNKFPLVEYLESPEDVKLAVNGAVFNHATLELGMDVKRALSSAKGSLEGHEGVVIRGLEDRPVKITGDFIVKGTGGEIQKKMIKEREEIEDVEKEYNIEVVNVDEEEGKRKIALIPGGFKPPHRGHLAMVAHYLDEVAPNGKVIIYMGGGGKKPRTINDNPVTFEAASTIWKIYLNNEGIPFPNELLDIVEVKGGPIGSVVDYVKDADPDREVIYLGAGEKDSERWKFMLDNPKYNPNRVHVFIEPAPSYSDREGNPMSATNFREAIESGDEELIKSYIPESSHQSYKEIMDSLNGQIKEDQLPLAIFLGLIEETMDEASPADMYGAGVAYIEDIVPPGSGKRDDDDELNEEDEELEEISAVGTGAVEGYNGSKKKNKETIIREVADYLYKSLGVDP